MLERLEDIDAGKRGSVELRLELAEMLKGLDDLEFSAEFLSPEARQVLDEARRRISIRYIV